VFESRWDLAGALQVLYRDPTLQADVVVYSPDDRFSITDDGLVVRLYGRSYFYRYGPKLLLFDDRRRTTLPLIDSSVARAHLVAPLECEPAEEGRGTVILPVDKWYHAVAAQGSAWRRTR
jgi:hypothetical protein